MAGAVLRPAAAAYAAAGLHQPRPLGLGIVFTGHLVTFYCIGTGIALLMRRVGGTPQFVWRIFWLDGITPWLLTAFIMWWGRRRALKLCTTKYNITTHKKLPHGALRIVQISDVHPRACAAMDHTRIPELREKIAACRPDLLVLTGDIFDEFTEPEELETFCSLFGEIDAPLGKYYVLGNHDLFHHWREPSFGRADLEQGLAKAGVRLLEDTGVMLPCGVRIVGRKDYLYTNGQRFTAAQLIPGGPDDRYTVWLDTEPRDFKNAAAAGADLILSGHTHGGQVWPAGAVGMVAKNERNYGQKKITDTCTAIVSGGTPGATNSAPRAARKLFVLKLSRCDSKTPSARGPFYCILYLCHKELFAPIPLAHAVILKFFCVLFL